MKKIIGLLVLSFLLVTAGHAPGQTVSRETDASQATLEALEKSPRYHCGKNFVTFFYHTLSAVSVPKSQILQLNWTEDKYFIVVGSPFGEERKHSSLPAAAGPRPALCELSRF